jgi:hypothetical protein
MAKDAALIDEATRLYVEDGMTLCQIAEAMPDVAESTLQTWSVKFNWGNRRARRRQLEQDLDGYVTKIKARLAEQLLVDAPDPQLIFALTRGLAVLKPSAAVELRKIEKAEADSQTLSPEEKRDKVKETIESIYGIKV